MTSFPVSESPHIRKEESGKSIAVKTLCALIIPILARFFLAPGPSLILLLGMLAGVFIAVFFKEKLFHARTPGEYWVTGVLSAVLITLMPLHMPPSASFLSGFFLIFFGIWFFGKYASLIFYPGVLACVLIANIYPDSFTPEIGHFKSTVLLSAALIGGVILCLTRAVSWRAPAIYLITVSAGAWVGIKFEELFSTWSLVIIAFFVLTDSATSPLKRSAQALSAFFAGLITLGLSPILSLGSSALIAALMVNALSPWLDEGK